MFADVFPQVSESPSLIWVVAAIIFNIVNVFLGLFMAFFKKKSVWSVPTCTSILRS